WKRPWKAIIAGVRRSIRPNWTCATPHPPTAASAAAVSLTPCERSRNCRSFAMPSLLRRVLVIFGLMFWQGGFTFYAAVVVPVGQQELGSHLQQGFITRQVTNYLNLAGAVALILLGWDVAATRDKSATRRWARWVAWMGMIITLLALVWLHQHL